MYELPYPLCGGTVVVTEESTDTLAPANGVLLAEERDHVLLLFLKPTAEHRHHELERKHR